MIRIGAGVDYVTDGLWRDFPDGGGDGFRARPGTCVDHYDAIRSDLKADISAGPCEHIEVRPYFQNLGIRLCRQATHRGENGSNYRDCSPDTLHPPQSTRNHHPPPITIQ